MSEVIIMAAAPKVEAKRKKGRGTGSVEKSSEAEGRVVGRKELWRGGSRVARAHRPRRTETTAARNATQRMERRAAQIGGGEGARSCYLFRRVHGKSILSPLLACWCPAHPERHSAAAPAALVSSRQVPSRPSSPSAKPTASRHLISLSLPSFHLIHRLISYPLSLLSPPSSAPPAHARAPAFSHDSPPRPRPRRLHLFRRRRKNGDRAFR
ncbi:hypothetical protein PVAP13_7KG370201 [Panicum virgatum]|uniref:Uncharacterized protein n=1 Tax=Panicum virgatum TaxID=38727 RepID=A0A8T0QRH8_PANVG|nr:hypothetical protein PVAP13_7KG370201 [Panicum virgatum]